MRILFGKYKGCKICDLPLSYLKWLNMQDIKNAELQTEIDLVLSEKVDKSKETRISNELRSNRRYCSHRKEYDTEYSSPFHPMSMDDND